MTLINEIPYINAVDEQTQAVIDQHIKEKTMINEDVTNANRAIIQRVHSMTNDELISLRLVASMSVISIPRYASVPVNSIILREDEFLKYPADKE